MKLGHYNFLPYFKLRSVRLSFSELQSKEPDLHKLFRKEKKKKKGEDAPTCAYSSTHKRLYVGAQAPI